MEEMLTQAKKNVDRVPPFVLLSLTLLTAPLRPTNGERHQHHPPPTTSTTHHRRRAQTLIDQGLQKSKVSLRFDTMSTKFCTFLKSMVTKFTES